MLMVRVHFLDIAQIKPGPNVTICVGILVCRVKLMSVVVFDADVSEASLALHKPNLTHKEAFAIIGNKYWRQRVKTSSVTHHRH